MKETAKFQLVANYEKDGIVTDNLNFLQGPLKSEGSRNSWHSPKALLVAWIL